MLTLDPDQLILDSLRDGFRDSLKHKLTSEYSSPFAKLIESTVAAHEPAFRKILNDAIADMTTTLCERQGQIEIGIISHEGHDFAALGACVHGREITAYTKLIHRQIVLTSWCGKTMLDCRNEVVRKFWSGSLALVFRLTNGRYIVGYALDERGMLFRGELLTNATENEAKRAALRISDRFAEIDAEDEANFDQDAA